MTGKPSLTLYNTLTRRKEAFSPIDADNVRMYVCGPTVYDFAHIGNARPVIVFDVLFRLLRHLYGAEHVTYVRNITDVDDKINARALRDFGSDIAAGRMSLNAAIRNVTEKTASQYHDDVKALGCLEPTHEPRATEHIDGMVAMIQTLIDKKNAYLAQGAEGAEILFDVVSMKGYGALSNRNLDEQQAGARIDVKDHKKNPGDFVLWKESSVEQPGWQGRFSVGGKAVSIHGRPGWHIECSVMSKAHLGEVFDIHGGGLDLIFPHHENEIAQSCCAHGTERMANVWMHNGYLQVEGRKMSKSEGNFVTIHDLLHTKKLGGRNWPGEVLRLAMLMTHYREPIDFSIKRLEEAESILGRWKRSVADLSNLKVEVPGIGSLSDDLDTVTFIKGVSDLTSAAMGSIYYRGPTRSDEQVLEDRHIAACRLVGLAGMLGFDLLRKTELTDEETEMIDARLAFIRDRNWAEADRIRDELLARGIQLKDGKDSETGERITTWEAKR